MHSCSHLSALQTGSRDGEDGDFGAAEGKGIVGSDADTDGASGVGCRFVAASSFVIADCSVAAGSFDMADCSVAAGSSDMADCSVSAGSFGVDCFSIPLLRRSVGVIFQDFRLIEKKTVYENLGFAMRAVGSSPREIKKRIPYVLELVGLEEKTDRYPNELSGGEQQRVAIARALINNPSTIIADEPTGNLDPARSLEIMRLLERINQLGTTMVVVTHEKDLVNQFKKRVVTLEQGVITSDGDGVGYNAR